MRHLENQHLRIGLGVVVWIIMIVVSQESMAAMRVLPVGHTLIHGPVSAGF
jgi:hypothetical protein